MKLNTGAQIWLWIVFVINIISFAISIINVEGLTELTGALLFLVLISVVAQVTLIVGIALLLFGSKKVGFYMIVACAVVAFVLNMMIGTAIVRAIINAVGVPLITYLFIQKQWDELA